MAEPTTFDSTDLAVVIPTRDRWDILQKTLDALAAQTAPGFEVLVVVNGADQTPPPLPGVRVVPHVDRGPGAGRNTGVAATDRALVLFLGDDTIPEPDLVQRHLDAHGRHPEDEAAILGYVTWHPSVAKLRFNQWLDWSGTQFDYDNFAGAADTDVGYGRFYASNLSIKRKFFDSVGGFDERFYFGYEDLDVGLRLHERGLRLFYEPAAIVRHMHGYQWAGIVGRFNANAMAERLMVHKHPWFEPFFLRRCEGALTRRPPLPVERLAEQVPDKWRRVKIRLRDQANARYHRRLAPSYIKLYEKSAAICELVDYLGDDFEASNLKHHEHMVDREAEEAPDEETFYRTSQNYLYDLTVFALSGTKDPYLEELRRQVPAGSSVLDYGCGIGTDGLELAKDGYRVAFADFDNPSTRYLRWRLERRELDATIHDLTGPEITDRFDAVICFDVIEHVPDPFELLGRLERLGRTVMVNFLDPEPDDTPLHHHLPIEQLLEYVASRDLLSYHRYWGRSHLVVYRGEGGVSDRSRRVLSRGRLVAAAEDRSARARHLAQRARAVVR